MWPSGLSKIELARALKCTLDTLAHVLHAAADGALQFGILLAQSKEFVGHVERGHDGDAIGAHHFSGVADFAHLLGEVFSGVEKSRPFIRRATHEVFLVENTNRDGGGLFLAHAVCSMVLRRPIIASTRARTWSFRCASTDRSLARDSWR